MRYLCECDLIQICVKLTDCLLWIALKSELQEYSTEEFYDYLTNQAFPSIRLPVQFLAAEAEIAWDNEKEARPIFDHLVSRFTGASEVESAILPAGGHNYEFSLNVGILWKRRKSFLDKLVRLYAHQEG